MQWNEKQAQIREVVDRLGRPSIEMLDAEIEWHGQKKSYRRVALGALVSLITTAATIVLVTNLWLAVLQVDGSSMHPLLQMGEIVVAVRKDSPEREDVIAFSHNDRIYIKRVIAVGGDRVDIRQDGRVFVNDVLLREPYAAELNLGSCDIELPFQVPTGTVFVLGDNRPASLDSRDSRFGPVDRERIIGKVVFRMWPLSRLCSVS